MVSKVLIAMPKLLDPISVWAHCSDHNEWSIFGDFHIVAKAKSKLSICILVKVVDGNLLLSNFYS